MLALSALPLNPPEDNFEPIERVMKEAFELFLKKGYNKSFQDIYDLVYEEIEDKLYKYVLKGEEQYVYEY